METDNSSDKLSSENMLYDGASNVVNEEAKHIEQWRGQKPLVGLALSGGGIRSASYCLGALQALAYKEALPNVDYLSTVSGGGYIGSSLSYLLYQSASGAMDTPVAPLADVSKENFPYVSYPMVGVGARAHTVPTEAQSRGEKLKGRLVQRLRQSSNHLVPGDGITFLSFAGVLMRNLAASLAVHIALLVALFQLFFMLGWFVPSELFQNPFGVHSKAVDLPKTNGFLNLGGWLILVYVAISVVYVPFTRLFDAMEKQEKSGPYRLRRTYEILTHWLFVAALAMLVVGGLPWVHEFMVKNNLMSIGGWLDILRQGDKTKPAAAGIVATVIGVIGNVWGFLQARSSKKPRIPTGLVVGVASVALFIGVLLLAYILTGWLHLRFKGDSMLILPAAGMVLLFFGWLPEANYVSLHRYYRDRLLELFLPDLKAMHEDILDSKEYIPLHRFLLDRFKKLIYPAHSHRSRLEMLKTRYARIVWSRPGDTTMLGNLCGATLSRRGAAARANKPTADQSVAAQEPEDKRLRGPYHIINANVVLTASQHPRYRPRGSDNFIFSPLFCGSHATGWTPTDPSPENGFTLATAMAISGAAVNPNAGPGGEGITRQPVLSVLMGLLNLRLGYWVKNPKWMLQTDAEKKMADADRKRKDWIKPNLIFPGLFESFGRFNLNEHARYLLLTDGGHFENLGLYELVRRRLKLIVVCDASCDPDFKFTNLANAIQKVRADFGAIIDIDAEQLATLVPRPCNEATKADASKSDANKADEESSAATRGYLIAPIRYSQRLGDDTNGRCETGTLIILKATAFEGLPVDLFSYRREHPEFPSQGTIDQFFDERQFDAYRELGYSTMYQMLKKLEPSASASPATETYTTPKGYDAQTDYTVASLLFGRGKPSSAGGPASSEAASAPSAL